MSIKDFLNKVDQALDNLNVAESINKTVDSMNDGINHGLESISESTDKVIKGMDEKKAPFEEEVIAPAKIAPQDNILLQTPNTKLIEPTVELQQEIILSESIVLEENETDLKNEIE